jgi:hypothetical protein
MIDTLASVRMNEEKMKLQLMFLLMDILMLLAYCYFWLKAAFAGAMQRRLKL